MPEWPCGDGEMATRIRARDWSTTSLGAAGTWPRALRTAVDIMLAMPMPATILWGAERVRLYNDAYAAIVGDGHPALLGRPAAEDVGRVPAFNHVQASIRDDADAVAGMLEMLVDTTPGDGHSQPPFTAGSGMPDRAGPALRHVHPFNEPDARGDPGEPAPDPPIPPEDRARASDAIDSAITPESMFERDHRVEHADGGTGRVASRAAPVPGSNGEIASDQRRDEHVHRNREMRRIALDSGGMGAWRWDLQRRLIWGDTRFLALWGFPPTEAMLPLSVFTERMSPRGMAEIEGIVVRAIGAGEEFDDLMEIVAGPTAGRWIHWRGRADGVEPSILHGISFDVTEQRRLATMLQESEERQAFLLDLGDRMRAEHDADAIVAHAARSLGERLRASRIVFAEIDEAAGIAHIRPGWTATGAHVHPAELSLAEFGGPMLDALRAGHVVRFDDVGEPPFARDELAALHAIGVRAGLSIPLLVGGRFVVNLNVHQHDPRHWTDAEVMLVEQVAERLWPAIERARAEAVLRASETMLAIELADTRQLHEISSSLIVGDDVDALYDKILDVARSLMRSDMASIQRVVPERHRLLLLAQRGFAPASADFWRCVGLEDTTSCGLAFARSEPVIVPDVEQWDEIAGTDDLAHYRLSGIRAMLSMPLVSRDGRLVGMMSTHWREVHQPSERELRLLDVLARQAADLIDRTTADEALRQSEQRLALAFKTLPVGIAIIDATGETVVSNDEMRRFLPTGRLPSRDPGRVPRWRGWDADGRMVQPEDFPGARALRGEGVFPGMQMLYRDDHGAEIWTEVLSAPLQEADGRIGGAISVVIDVDRLKRSEEAARTSEERLRQFGEASQDILWIRDAATLQWVYLTPAFEPIYGLSRDEALSGDNYRNWQDLIVPDDRSHAIASIARVVAGEWVTFEYRVRRPSDGTIRWLRNTDFPITDPTGAVVLIGGIGHDFTEAREAELRLQVLVEGMPQLVWRGVDGGEWTWASPQWTAFTGQRMADYRDWGWLSALHPDDRANAREAWAHALDHGGFEVEYRIRRHDDGEYRWFQTRAAPVRDLGGTIIEWLGTSTDIHDLRELQERQKVLVAELQHRTRNLMGVVRSMADKTARASDDLPDFRVRFRDRLEALSRVQGLLSRMNDHDRVTFDELIDTELAAMDGSADHVTVDGPVGVRLRSSTVQTLAMALHELATNAMKYGALGQATGRLAITWRLEAAEDGGPWLRIDWRESGVTMPPADAAPHGTGQGRELIERALPYQLRAKTSYMLGPDGVRCTILIPVSASTAEVE